jgi:hypothetical protein
MADYVVYFSQPYNDAGLTSVSGWDPADFLKKVNSTHLSDDNVQINNDGYIAWGDSAVGGLLVGSSLNMKTWQDAIVATLEDAKINCAFYIAPWDRSNYGQTN